MDQENEPVVGTCSQKRMKAIKRLVIEIMASTVSHRLTQKHQTHFFDVEEVGSQNTCFNKNNLHFSSSLHRHLLGYRKQVWKHDKRNMQFSCVASSQKS